MVEDKRWSRGDKTAFACLIVGLVYFSDDAGDHRKDVCRWLQAPFSPTNNPSIQLCEVHNELVK
jgi:hypothetical protein